MKYAIIGCGKFGKIHLKTLLEMKKDVKYICNKTDSKFQEIKTEFNFELKDSTQFITDYSIVLNDPEVTIVSITTGPHQHYELVKAALNAGKHVICEKPFVFTKEQCEELYDLSEKNKLILLVNYPDIFSSELIESNFYHVIQKRSEENDIRIFYQNFGSGPCREDYSPIWDYGCHVAAFAYCCFATSYKKTDVWKLSSKLIGCLSVFTNKTKKLLITAQFGNCFSERVKGISISLPSELTTYNEDGISSYIINLKT
jgi:predicted dehydrogenase